MLRLEIWTEIRSELNSEADDETLVDWAIYIGHPFPNLFG
jgi:hypothetical protein